MSDPKTEVTVTTTLRERLNDPKMLAAMREVLPSHVTPERMVRFALLAAIKAPMLEQCTRASVYACMMRLSQLGLEADGYHAHLIPHWSGKKQVYECTLIVDYKGLAALATESGLLAAPPNPQLVCENDVFTWDRGDVVEHRIDWRKPRGECFAVYSTLRLKSGGEHTHVMSFDEIEKVRRGSQQPSSGPWKEHWPAMAKKSVFRAQMSWIPTSGRLRDALAEDDDVPIDVDAPPEPAAKIVVPVASKVEVEPVAAPAPEPPSAVVEAAPPAPVVPVEEPAPATAPAAVEETPPQAAPTPPAPATAKRGPGRPSKAEQTHVLPMTAATPAPTATPQERLRDAYEGLGYTFAEVSDLCNVTGYFAGSRRWMMWTDVSDRDAETLIRVKSAYARSLAKKTGRQPIAQEGA